MQRTANPGNLQDRSINPDHYIALAHELRSATLAHVIDTAFSRVTGRISRAVQWLNSHPVIS